MSKEDENKDLRIVFSDDGRATVNAYPYSYRFRVGDKVMFSAVQNDDGTEVLEGPYFVETVPALGLYTLCSEDGYPERGGMVVKEINLRQAS